MIKDQLAHIVRQLMKTADLKPEDADLIWQWLEGVNAVPLWAGLEPSLYEKQRVDERNDLPSQVEVWMEGRERFTLGQRKKAFETRFEPHGRRAYRARIAVGEGEDDKNPPKEE